MIRLFVFFSALMLVCCLGGDIQAQESAKSAAQTSKGTALKSIDSATPLKIGDAAPDFVLPGVSGEPVSLRAFRGVKNVLITFIPAAWTPVCSGQWPGYNIAKEIFDENDAVLIGVSVDNTPTQKAWIAQMGGLWFPVASDFWPHGNTAQAYGVLRNDGMAERALFLVDKDGVLRYIDVHDINKRPDLGEIVKQLTALPRNPTHR